MVRIHSSFHKCLTMYYMRVMDTLYNKYRPFKRRYEHYESIEGVFYNSLHKHKIISVNGFAVDVSRLGGEFRIVRFVRDPRDLVVSGYFYHKRAAEPWFRFKSPTSKYWQPINGNVPDAMPADLSYADYLQGIAEEDGLIAEIQFRRFHLESLRAWPEDERIRIFKYEQILGNEALVFAQIFDFFELPWHEKLVGTWLAKHYAADNRRFDRHIRDPSPGQLKQHFTPRVQAYFDQRYADLIPLLGY